MKKIYSKLFAVLGLCIFAGLGVVNAQAPDGFTTVDVIFTQGAFETEVGWVIVDANDNILACKDDYVTDQDDVSSFELPNDTEFSIRGFDTFGDGWNGCTIEIVANEDASAYTNGCLPNNLPVVGSITLANVANETGSCTNAASGTEIAAGLSIGCVSCLITCPDDVVVPNDAGLCSAQVAIDLPTLENCSGVVIGDCVDFAGEADLVFDGGGASNGLLETVVEIMGVPLLDTLVSTIDVEICVSGDFGDDLLELTELSAEGMVVDTIGDETSAVDCATFCTVLTLTNAEYNMFAADGIISFTLAANPNVNPICASQFITATVCVPEIVDVMPPFSNDFNGTEDASDEYPVGVTTVTYTSQDANGTASTCTFTVTVEDTEAPTIDCPGDITLQLAAGDCEITFNGVVNFDDNCGIAALPTGDPAPVPGPFGSLEACAGNDGFTVACNGGNTSVVQALDLSAIGGQVVFLTEGCFIFDNAAWGLTQGTVRLYCTTGTTPPSFLTGAVPVATGAFNASGTASGDVFCATFDEPYLVDGSCGGTLWLEVDATGVGGLAFMGDECNGISADGTNTFLASTLCGSGFLSNFGFSTDAFFGYTAQPAAFVVPGGDNEFALGEPLPIGVHDFAFEVSDDAGNVTACEFTVTVNEFPEALQTDILSCNGQINISVNDACDVVLDPDMFLEGGMHGCYATDYQINIWPFNNEAAAISNVGGVEIDFNGLLDAQHTYEIVDLDTGNKCWGNFIVEDKLAPTIACQDLVLGCDDPTDVGSLIPGGLSTYPGTPGGVINNTMDPVEVEIAAGGGAVTDLTLDLDISHTWIGDLTIELTSPAGTTVTVFDGNCGNTDNLVASFEDGAPAFDCGNPAVGNTYAPEGSFADFNGEQAAGTWLLLVEDGVGGDNGTLNEFSLKITDAGLVIGGAVAIDNCGGSTVDFTEVVIDGNCTTEFASQILRTWTATDASGNVSESCTQTLSITRETLATIELPLNWDGLAGNNPVIECSNAVLNNAGELSPAVYGSPSGAGACGTIISYYTDVVLPICDQTCSYDNNTYKVVRKWTILDWCTGEILEPVQILKVMDTTAPVISDLADMTVSTDIWGCGATIQLPAAAATDNCTADESISYNWTSTAGTYNASNNTFVLADPAKTMPGAPVVITATATDCCGNSASTSFNVTVADLVPPVVVAETTRTVSLTTDGTAKIFAESFDDGSHDGCGPIGFSVKRMDNGSPCPSFDKFPPAGNDNAQFNEAVFFCCADAGDEPVMVQFRVCDDADMNGIIGSFGDNCNIAMVEVYVQDKLAPQIICPPNATISCIDLAGIDLSDTDLLDGLFGEAVAAGTCNVTVTQVAVGNENCGAGVIFRNFTATNAAGSNSCQQIITVTAGPDNSLTCNRIGLDTGNPVFAGLNSCAKMRFENGPTQFACVNQMRWWCAVNDNVNNNTDDIPALEIDCQEGFAVPEVVLDINGLCTEAGVSIEVDTFQFAGGACQKYLVHYEVIDQCIFDENYVNSIGEIDPYNSDNGYFELYLEIDAFDNIDPVPSCEDITVTATSCTGINTEITVTATDNCTSPEFFGYQWRLDVGANNTIDFPSSGWYASSSVTPGVVGLSEFPIGTHRIFWIISDGCGNDATCSQLVTITENDKAPTPYCFDGLAVAVMPSTGTVALWANDFDAGSFDNCPGELLLTMVPEQDIVGLSDDQAYDLSFTGTQQPNGDYGWEFNCDYIENGISAVIEVRIYVTDASGNWDYCTASLRLDDNFDACPDNGTVTYEVTGKLETELGNDLTDANVTVNASFPEFPMTETVNGTYSFDLYQNVDYTIIPTKNDNHLNGVTTLDIVMIQKHILGLDLLDSPYQLIAADVNNDCNVSGADLVQIRKLILGKYPNEQFPSNDSWRFVEADYNFTNPEAPCNFSEVSEIFNLSADEINDFVAAKIGDVNATAKANATMTASTRSAENLEFVVIDQNMSAGTNRVEVLAKDFNEVYGFQYTMNFNNVEFVSVEAGALNVTENNFGLNANGNLLVSFDDANGVSVADDAVLFTIVVNASNNNLVSNAISINSNAVAAEAYIGSDLEVLGSDVVFRTNEGEVAANAFALFQNEPNPFNGATVIGFELPATAETTLSVYDVTGKVLYTKVDTYAKGYHTVTLNRSDLASTGVLYYKLESGDNVATMKMIIIE